MATVDKMPMLAEGYEKLTSEVRQPEDLEHADVLLGTHPKAAAWKLLHDVVESALLG